MPWFKVDDRIPFHRKTMSAGLLASSDERKPGCACADMRAAINEAMGAWMRAGAWSSAPENRTDGWIPDGIANSIASASVWDRLIVAGFIEAREPGATGYQMHDFLVYNPAADEKRAKDLEISRKRSEAGRKGNEKRWGATRKQSQTIANAIANESQSDRPDPDPVPGEEEKVCRAPVREEQEECQDEQNPGGNLCDPDDQQRDAGDFGSVARGLDARQRRGGGVARGETGLESPPPAQRELRQREQADGGDPDAGTIDVASGRGLERVGADSKDPEDLLLVLARLVAAGDPWAVSVERWRQDNPGRALTEAQRKPLRRTLAEEASHPRPTVTAADEADTAAIVGAYEAARRRILGDRQYEALTAEWNDARKILPDLRLLRERRQVTASLAEIVAHKLETYLRDPKNRGVNFALRWLLDRTEQDDLPRPKAKARASPAMTPEALPPRQMRALKRLSAEDQADLDELKRKLIGDGNVEKS